MIQTKIKRALALIALVGLASVNIGNTFATQIGTGSVVGTSTFDAVINWDDSFPGSASGQVQNILIKARVLPTLNMSISTGTIDLGDLSAGTASTGALDIEIGTNAVSGVSITARSQSGGLTNTTDNDVKINANTPVADPVSGELYNWSSTPNGTDDSSYTSFAATGLASTAVVDDSTEHTVYSTNKPEATSGVDDVNFEVSATAQAETPAGNYEDRVTFTVTGTF